MIQRKSKKLVWAFSCRFKVVKENLLLQLLEETEDKMSKVQEEKKRN